MHQEVSLAHVSKRVLRMMALDMVLAGDSIADAEALYDVKLLPKVRLRWNECGVMFYECSIPNANGEIVGTGTTYDRAFRNWKLAVRAQAIAGKHRSLLARRASKRQPKEGKT